MELTEKQNEELKQLAEKLADAFKKIKEYLFQIIKNAWEYISENISSVISLLKKLENKYKYWNTPVRQRRMKTRINHQIYDNKPRYMIRKIIY